MQTGLFEVHIRIKLDNTPIVELTIAEARQIYEELKKIFWQSEIVNPCKIYPAYPHNPTLTYPSNTM